LFHRADGVPEIASIIAESLRSILRTQVVEPGQSALPWIGGTLDIVSS
jgi:hypothetical protein